MNVETGTETAQFPEKKYINGIFVAGRQKARRMTGTGQDMKNWHDSKRGQDERKRSTDPLVYLAMLELDESGGDGGYVALLVAEGHPARPLHTIF